MTLPRHKVPCLAVLSRVVGIPVDDFTKHYAREAFRKRGTEHFARPPDPMPGKQVALLIATGAAILNISFFEQGMYSRLPLSDCFKMTGQGFTYWTHA